MKDWVLPAFAVVGGVVALLGVVMDVNHRAHERWSKQQADRRIDYANIVDGTLGEDAAAVEKLRQQETRDLIETGRSMWSEEPAKTRSQLWRGERGLPFGMTVEVSHWQPFRASSVLSGTDFPRVSFRTQIGSGRPYLLRNDAEMARSGPI